jgi:uncharacterized membrane protein/predicted DsbA family dithiol-disulfide isomerase
MKPMSAPLRKLALAFAAAGFVVSLLAAYTHYRMLADAGYVSFCDVSATVSCTQVYSSRFGTFAGIPVAVFGAIWFALATLLAIAGVVARADVRESVPGYLFAGSTIALAAVLYLGYASFVILGLVCVLCVITYAAVIGLFLVSGAATSLPMSSLPGRIARDLKVMVSSPAAIALALLFVGAVASTLALFPREASSAGVAEAAVEAAAAQGAKTPELSATQRSEFERYYTGQPRLPLVVPAEGAKVLVVKFNDYQCPPCRATYMEYKGIFAKYESSQPGAVRLVLKDFPLDSECNASITTDLHTSACEAAVAVRLAREHARAEQLEQWIFDNQSRLTPQLVREGAREVGQVTDFDARYPKMLEAVKADIAYGRELGVTATPTFFINGVRISGGLPPVYFDQAIGYELARATSK